MRPADTHIQAHPAPIQVMRVGTWWARLWGVACGVPSQCPIRNPSSCELGPGLWTCRYAASVVDSHVRRGNSCVTHLKPGTVSGFEPMFDLSKKKDAKDDAKDAKDACPSMSLLCPLSLYLFFFV